MNCASIKKLLSVMCVALVAASSVQAAPVAVPISDLYNTGMSSPWSAGVQTPLPGSDPGQVADPHWSVKYDPQGLNPLAYYGTKTMVDGAFPFNLGPAGRFQLDLAADTARVNSDLDNSQWLIPQPDPLGGNIGPQVYVYEATFTTTQTLTSISISGFFKATDVLAVQLNGGALVDPGSPHGASGEFIPTKPARAFTVTGTGGLTNTLRFYVNRPGTGIAGFRAQFTNAAFTVPEPSTIVLGALGLVGFGITRLRRRFLGAAKAD